MFSEEQVKSYKNITAPENLRQRVIDSAPSNKKRFNPVMKGASLAACLALIIAVSLVLGSMGGLTVYTNGQVITEDGVPVYSAVSAMSARGMFGINLEAELSEKTFVSSKDGNVYIYGEDGTVSEGETEGGKVTIVWDIVPTDTEKTYVLTFESSRGATEITLLFNETAGWMLCCDK